MDKNLLDEPSASPDVLIKKPAKSSRKSSKDKKEKKDGHEKFVDQDTDSEPGTPVPERQTYSESHQTLPSSPEEESQSLQLPQVNFFQISDDDFLESSHNGIQLSEVKRRSTSNTLMEPIDGTQGDISDGEFFERASKTSNSNVRKSVNLDDNLVFGEFDGPGISQPERSEQLSFDAFQSECSVSISDADKEDEETRILVYIALVEALYTYGCSALNLVGYADNMSHSLNLPKVSVRLGATGFWLINHRKCDYVGIQKSVNMNKLGKVVALVRKICSVRKDCQKVLETLDGIHNLPSVYHPIFKFLMFPMYGMGFTVFFFGGDAISVGIAALVGSAIGIYNFLNSWGVLRHWNKLEIFLMALLAGVLTGLFANYSITSFPCAYSAALGSTAYYFPGVAVSFSVLEMMLGMITVGALRFVYSQFISQLIATGLAAGWALWTSVINPGSSYDQTDCVGLGDAHYGYGILFYFLLYFSALICYQIPLRLALPFFVVQATTYVTYFLLSLTIIGPYVSTGIAVLVMVILSALLSHRHLRKFFPEMTPMATIIPTLELLVPGSTMVKIVLEASTGNANSSTAIALTYTSISIAVGFLIAEACLKTFAPMASTLNIPLYKGSLNRIAKEDAFKPEIAKMHLPPGCSEYLIIIVQSGHNLIPSDKNGYSDPYVQFKLDGDIIARSEVVPNTLDPIWEAGFIIPIIPDASGNMTFTLEVMDYDRFSSDDFLGEMTFEINKDTQALLASSKKLFSFHKISKDDRITKKIALDNVASGKVEMTIGYYNQANLSGKLTGLQTDTASARLGRRLHKRFTTKTDFTDTATVYV